MAKAGRPTSSGAGKRWRERKRLPGSTARIVPEPRSQLPLPREMRVLQPFLVDVPSPRCARLGRATGNCRATI
jgi:hypothetical protein